MNLQQTATELPIFRDKCLHYRMKISMSVCSSHTDKSVAWSHSMLAVTYSSRSNVKCLPLALTLNFILSHLCPVLTPVGYC